MCVVVVGVRGSSFENKTSPRSTYLNVDLAARKSIGMSWVHAYYVGLKGAWKLKHVTKHCWFYLHSHFNDISAHITG